MLRRLRRLMSGSPAPTGKRRYVFIVTYARSGSTVLQNIVGRLPHAHIIGENNDVLGGMYRSWRSAAEAKAEQGNLPRVRTGDPWRGAHLIDPARFNQKLAELFIDEIIQPPQDATLVGFKEVRYFDYGAELPCYLDYIRMTFQPALLVFNRRRGSDVANSAWWRQHPGDIAAEVAAFDALAGAYAQAHPEAVISLDYDVWKLDPEALRPLFDRLGIRVDRSSLRRALDEKLDH